MPNNGQSNYDREMERVREFLREEHAQQRREEAARKRAEKREAQCTAKRESNQRSKSLPWICRFDNALNDFLKQYRNY